MLASFEQILLAVRIIGAYAHDYIFESPRPATDEREEMFATRFRRNDYESESNTNNEC